MLIRIKFQANYRVVAVALIVFGSRHTRPAVASTAVTMMTVFLDLCMNCSRAWSYIIIPRCCIVSVSALQFMLMVPVQAAIYYIFLIIIYLLNKIYYYCLVGGPSMQRNIGFVRIFWRITMKRSYSRFNEYGA